MNVKNQTDPRKEFDNSKVADQIKNTQSTSENASQSSSQTGQGKPDNSKNQTTSANQTSKASEQVVKKKKKRKGKNGKKRSEGVRNDAANQSTNGGGDGNSVKGSGDGSQAGADNFKDATAIATGNTVNVGGVTEKILGLTGYAVNGNGAFALVPYDIMNQNKFDSESVANNLINYSRSTKDTYNLRNILGLRKEFKVPAYPTLQLGFQQEAYDINRDYYAMYFLNPFSEKIKELNIAIPPYVTSINYVMGFNIHGHFPSYNPFLKDITKTYQDGVTEFNYKEPGAENLCYLGKNISVKTNDLTAAQALKKGSGQRHFIGGHNPEKGDEVEFKVLEHKVEYNSKRIKKFGDDIILSDNLVTDCGTWRVVQSDKQFVENFVNAVLNDPELAKMAGLTKHTRVLLHANATLVEAGTMGRIMKKCIMGAINALPTIGKKIGKIDTTAKYLFTAPVNVDLRNNINRFFAAISKFPFNKKVVDDFDAMSGVYLTNDSDPYAVNNPFITVSNLISGLFKHFEYYNDPFHTETVRDNMASPSIVIPIGPVLKSFFTNAKKYMNITAGYHKRDEMDIRNAYINVKDNLVESVVQSTDLDEVSEHYVLNSDRITSIFLNQIKNLFEDSSFIEKLEDYTRKVSLFLSMYRSDKILSDTDYAMDIIAPIDWITINEKQPKVFPHKSLIQSLGLGTEFPQVDIVSKDFVEDFNNQPRWFLRAAYGDQTVKYQNMLGFLITSGSLPDLEKDFLEFISDWKDDVKADLHIDEKLYQVNFLDATYLPFIADVKHIALGWNDGVIAHGERYKFDSGVADQSNYLSWACSVFEYTLPGHASLVTDSLKTSTNLTANAPDGGYFVFQTMTPLVGLSDEYIYQTVYEDLGFDNFPVHYYLGAGKNFISRFSKPWWLLSVVQKFRNDIFKGLSAMAGGIPYADLPTLKMCDLAFDYAKSGSGN